MMGVCSALACVAGITSPARAQSRDEVSAEAIFLQGKRALESGQFALACAKFAESQRLDPGAGTLMNLATCEEKLGKLASAWQHWKEAIDALAPNDGRVAFANARTTALEARLSRLSIVLAPGTDPQARVFRDEVELGAASQGVPLPVDSGDHTVTVVASGRAPEQVTVSIREAEQKVVEVHAGAPAPASPVVGASAAVDVPLSGSAHRRGNGLRTLGWVVGGVGLAGAATAAVTGIVLLNDRNIVAANCVNKVCTTQKALDAASSGKALLVVNGTSFVVAGLGLGLGAYLVVAHSGSGATAALAPGFGPDGAAISCAGTF
jgi:hypothetical protein